MALKLDSPVRQEQIAQAALAVVAQGGLKRLNLAQVARRVGVVPSALYRHFKNKDAIIDTVLSLVRTRLLENVDAVTALTPEPMEQLRLLLARHVGFIRENEALPRLVFAEQVYDGRPGRRRAMFRAISAYLDRVGAIVKRGQVEGRIRKDLDPATVALMFLGIIQPAAILWDMSAGEFDVTRHAERAWEVFETGIRAA